MLKIHTPMKIPSCYRRFFRGACLLFLFGLHAPIIAMAQDGEGGIDITAKARVSAIYFADGGTNSFNYAPSGAAGLHLGVSKNFGRWVLETGIGADRLSFVHRSKRFPHSTAFEEVTFQSNFFAVQIPLALHYKVSDDFHIAAGLNMMAANLNSYSLRVSSGAAGASGFESSEAGEFPGFQYTAEAHIGVRYRLSPRFALAAHANTGLHPLSGMDLNFASENAESSDESFEYRWFRTGIELIYKLK